MARNKKKLTQSALATPTEQVSSDSDTEADVRSSTKARSKAGSSISDLGRKVDELSAKVSTQQQTITSQQQTIDVLTTRLNFVLSMFGVADSFTQSTGATADLGASSDVTANTSMTPGIPQPGSARSTASSPQSSFQSAVLSTVYTEKKIQENRAKNFVVSGLPLDATCDDNTAVTTLCQNELDITPNIVSCRRLGNRIEGKTQRLLVTLRSTQQAETIISSAKNLRNSAKETVRNKVFINADLTKAQAAAEYQARCQRRKNQAEKRQQQNNSTDGSLLRAAAVPFMPSGSACD